MTGFAHRLRSFGWFLLALLYAALAHQFSARAAGVLAPGGFALASRLIFLLLVLVGYAAMGALGQRQRFPIAAMGLSLRTGAAREWGMGAALGWAGVVACVLPVALSGGLLVSMANGGAQTVGELLFAILAVLAWTLTDELLFRGYPFQCLIEAIGPTLATILMAVLFAVVRTGGFPGAGSGFASLLLGFLLAMAYLRTRALWVGWGFHFAWNATTAVLFGLPAAGVKEFAPVFSTYTSGSAWLTGGGWGPEGSGVAVVVLLALFIVLSRATRELRHRWAMPEIVGAGIAVDIDALSRRQHEQGMGPGAPSPPPLVQILPAEPLPGKPEEPRKPQG